MSDRREVVIWKREGAIFKARVPDRPAPQEVIDEARGFGKGVQGDNNNKETTMTTLTGDKSETELDLPQQQALARAISLLEPHETHPVVGAALDKLRGAAGEDKDDDGSQMLEKIERSLTDMSVMRSELAKSDTFNPVMAERAAKAERALQTAYLQRVSGAHQGWRGEHLERMRKVESGGIAA